MTFESTDYDWSDYHKGLSRERRMRYEKLTDEILAGLKEILVQHNEGQEIVALVPEGIFSVAVRGDQRCYMPIVGLVYGKLPSNEHMTIMTSTICNSLPVSRVIVCLTKRVITLQKPPVQLIVDNTEYDNAVAKLKKLGALEPH